MAGLSYLTKFNLRSEDDIAAHGQLLERLKEELSDTDKNFEAAESEKHRAANNYKTYLWQMQSDYDYILEKMRREQEELEQAERDFQLEKSRETRRKNDYFSL